MNPELLATLRHPNHSVKVMRAAIEDEGLDWVTFARDAGAMADWTDPDHLVSGAQEITLQRAFAKATGAIPGAWLRVGERYRLMSYGSLGLAISAAKNMGKALQTLIEYQALTYSLLQYGLSFDGDQLVALEASDHLVADDLQEFYQERALGSVIRFLNDMKPATVRVERIESVLNRAPNWLGLEARLNIPIVFKAPKTRWIFAAGAGQAPMPMADDVLCETYRRLCAKQIEEANGLSGFEARFYSLFTNVEDAPPSLTDAAQRLEISARTLSRRLSLDGLSYQKVVDNLRMQRAQELLRANNMSVEDISARLGFAETASFSRAFKKWYGEPPLRYRQNYRLTQRITR